MGVEPESKGQDHTPFVHCCNTGSSLFLRMWQISMGKQNTHTHRRPKKKPAAESGSRGSGGEELGSRHQEDLTTQYMALCGFGSVGGDTSRPLAPRDEDGVGPMCLSLCGTPTSEMSNAGLVGPDPAPNHSDWPTRAVCAPRWFCRSEGVAGALSFKCLEKRAVPGPLSLTGPSQRSGWEITRGISGSGKSTPPSDRRRHGIFANTDGHLSFCERGAGSRTIPCKPCFYVGRQSSGGSETPACTGNMWVKQVNWHPALPMVDQVAASFG